MESVPSNPTLTGTLVVYGAAGTQPDERRNQGHVGLGAEDREADRRRWHDDESHEGNDTPSKSRNEVLASLMRRFRICEERGSGIDIVIDQVEAYQLPAPFFEVPDGFTRIVLFAYRPLNEMDNADRVRACYLHAWLKWVMRDYLTNVSLRERFGIEEKNKAAISRYIREAVTEELIKPFDEDAPKRLMKYVPFWA